MADGRESAFVLKPAITADNSRRTTKNRTAAMSHCDRMVDAGRRKFLGGAGPLMTHRNSRKCTTSTMTAQRQAEKQSWVRCGFILTSSICS